MEAEYNAVALYMHFYSIVMDTFCCWMFAVQQLLQCFPGSQFAQHCLSPLPYGNNGQCSLLQPPAAPAQLQTWLLHWSRAGFDSLAVLSVAPAAVCLQTLPFSSRFLVPFAGTLLWTYLVLTGAQFCEKHCNDVLLFRLKVGKNFFPFLVSQNKVNASFLFTWGISLDSLLRNGSD